MEAEDLGADSTQWKVAGDRLRAILDEWKTITGLDRKTDDPLWKRYSTARDTFNRRRGSHFADLDRERAGAKQAKEELCDRAEALSASTEWAATAATFRDLLTQWKAAGRASTDVDDALWGRFKAAQDVFFAARNAATSERDAEFEDHAEAKEALLAVAERLDLSDHRRRPRRPSRPPARSGTTSARYPASVRDLERRLRAVEKRIRDAPSAVGRPGGSGPRRAVPGRVEQFEDQAAKAEAAGKTKDAEQARASRPSSGVSGPSAAAEARGKNASRRPVAGCRP